MILRIRRLLRAALMPSPDRLGPALALGITVAIGVLAHLVFRWVATNFGGLP